jgi:hypothetical protein
MTQMNKEERFFFGGGTFLECALLNKKSSTIASKFVKGKKIVLESRVTR